ncbi:contractile injection system protein, VgrG/Pvc8 family [Paenibacillus tundrae]|uniref:contractile injection system protein, VgrG/Pvc8 family n=1 Tax=Paenibacillus tundrae TaxID=528187 RepID=UPI0030CBFA2B
MSLVTVSYEQLQIQPFDIRIHEVTLLMKVHDHGKLTFTGVIPEEKEEQYVRMADESTPVELFYTDEQGQKQRLFHGIILKLHVKVENKVYWLEAEAVSHSHAMDLRRKTRSYQNISMLIPDVMQKISGSYPDGQVFNTFIEKKKLGAYTLQYQETDWEFLKRLASHYHTVLVPVSTEERIRIYLGLPEQRDAGKLEATHYRMYKDMLAYQKEAKLGTSDINEKDYIRYEVQVRDRVLQLGDQVQFKGHSLYVFEIRTEMKKGLLLHHYVLGHKASAYRRKRYNSRLVGASISGNIMGVVRDEVQVHLDSDQEWSLATAYLFPYSTMYASDDQTGWYCMPEKGDSIRLYFPNARENEGIALSSVRQKLPAEKDMASAVSSGSGASSHTGGSGSGNSSGAGGGTTTIVQQQQLQPVVNFDKDLKEDLMANPNTKFLLTPTGQKITFEEDRITITGSTGGATLTLTSAGTIILNCENKITLQASKQVELVAETVTLQANQIDMSTKDGNGGLTIDQGQVVIKGIEILMNQ